MSTIVANHPVLLLVFIFLCCLLLGIRLGHAIGLPSPGWKGAAQLSSLMCLALAVFMMSVHEAHEGLLSVEDVVSFAFIFLASFAGGAARAGYITKSTGG